MYKEPHDLYAEYIHQFTKMVFDGKSIIEGRNFFLFENCTWRLSDHQLSKTPHCVCSISSLWCFWHMKHKAQCTTNWRFWIIFFWRLSQLKWMSTILLGSVGSGIKNIIFKGIIISSICCFHARLHYTCIQMGTILIQHNEERHFDYVMSQTKRLWRTPQVTGCRHYSSEWRSYKVLLKLNCGFLCFPSLFCYPLW